MWRFIASVAFVIGASFSQLTGISLAGIKPNLTLVLLAVLAQYHKNWFTRAVLALIAALMLAFEPSITWSDALFVASAFLTMALVDYLPWREMVNALTAVLAGTFVLHLAAFQIRLFAFEAVVNALITIVLFWLIQFMYAKEIPTPDKF